LNPQMISPFTATTKTDQKLNSLPRLILLSSNCPSSLTAKTQPLTLPFIQ